MYIVYVFIGSDNHKIYIIKNIFRGTTNCTCKILSFKTSRRHQLLAFGDISMKLSQSHRQTSNFKLSRNITANLLSCVKSQVLRLLEVAFGVCDFFYHGF